MKREGFISIIALIIMSVLLVMVLYLGQTSQQEYLILNSSILKTQGYYQSEGKLYLSLFDEKYYSEQLYLKAIEAFRGDKIQGNSNILTIDNYDLDLADSGKDVVLKFFVKDKRATMNMIAESNNSGVVTKLTSSGTLVNEIFESGYPVLSHESVSEEHKDEVGKILLQINEEINIDNCHKPESLFGEDFKQYNKIIFSKKDSKNHELSCKRDTMTGSYITGYSGNQGIIIARKQEGSQLDFFIGEPGNPKGDIELIGILYVNGNLIISDNIHIKGILIVENGEIIINSSKRPKVTGIAIMNNLENYDDFIEKTDIIVSRDMMYLYGTYIPGFMDPQISIVKNNLMKEWRK